MWNLFMVAVCMGAMICSGCGSIPDNPKCETNDDCVEGYLCEEGGCVERDPVRIVTTELPAAMELAPMDCDGDRTNGCDTSVWEVADCGNTCTGRDNCYDMVNHVDQLTCQQGVCSYLNCSMDYGDCNNDTTDGCESYLQNNEAHCGQCDVQCEAVNGTNTCIDGVCIPDCDGHWDSCDDNPNNGCETNTYGNQDHCGSCGNACIPPQVCNTTTCEDPL